ncbi:MAG: dethiobiotin synthase [Deltaproteobacteria bacterium]|nr:dethiobiotin synthase [Deltaproteobacteria bacterium]
MRQAYFITGTDTNVGKTFVTASLAKGLRAKGHSVGVMKPVETGCEIKDGRLIPHDALALKDAAGCLDQLDAINPYRFPPPISPNIAARLEGVEIDFSKIDAHFRELQRLHDIMFVEGAGGLLVPLTETETIADLVLFLGIPLVIVAASRLGVLNHTLLTIESAKMKGIEIKGVILNAPKPQDGDQSVIFHKAELERLTGVACLAEIPFTDAKKEAPESIEGLLRAFL